jgi:purine-binding chemotaxis protein CheW
MEGVLTMNVADARVARDEFLSFRLGAEEYAIDILQVREIRAHERATRMPNAPDFMKGVINLRGAIVPIMDLRVRFGFTEEHGASTVTIILSIAERAVGIVVDAVSDVVALGRDEIRPAPELKSVLEDGFIRGIAPMDGRMLIVLDIARLMASPGMALAAEAA